jgi:hypothetical protein
MGPVLVPVLLEVVAAEVALVVCVGAAALVALRCVVVVVLTRGGLEGSVHWAHASGGGGGGGADGVLAYRQGGWNVIQASIYV